MGEVGQAAFVGEWERGGGVEAPVRMKRGKVGEVLGEVEGLEWSDELVLAGP